MIFRRFWSNQHQVAKNTFIASVLVIVAALLLYFYKFDGDITGFFRIGSVLPLSPYLKGQHVLVHQGEIGYDGQQFLSIALDPWLQNQDSLETFDSPKYRYRRILYPLLGYLLSLGNRNLIPYVLVVINCLCIILLVFFIGLDMHKHQQPVWQSLLVLVVPGIWIILSFSTADLLSSLLLAIAIYCYRSHKNIYTSISLSLACLTREPMLLVWLGFLLTSIYERKRQQMLHLFWAWIPPVAWNIYVLFRFSDRGTSGIRENFGWPLAGIADKISQLVTNGLQAKNLFEAYSFALLILMFVGIILRGCLKS